MAVVSPYGRGLYPDHLFRERSISEEEEAEHSWNTEWISGTDPILYELGKTRDRHHGDGWELLG